MFKIGDMVKTKCDGRVGVIASSWQYAGSVVYEIEFFLIQARLKHIQVTFSN